MERPVYPRFNDLILNFSSISWFMVSSRSHKLQRGFSKLIIMFCLRASSVWATIAVALISATNANSQFLEYVGTGFCKDSQGLFYARGEAEKFDDPQACMNHCRLLDDLDLVAFAYKFSNKRCHCNYNVGSEVIATCDRSVFTNGCRSNEGYTGSGFIGGTEGPTSWGCYAYDPSPTLPPMATPVAEPTMMTRKKAAIRNVQNSISVEVETPSAEPRKDTKKGSGSKNKGKRKLKTATPVGTTAAPVSIPIPKGAKKGSGSTNKGKRKLQTSSPIANTVAPVSEPTPLRTKKGRGSENKGKGKIRTFHPVAVAPVSEPTSKGVN